MVAQRLLKTERQKGPEEHNPRATIKAKDLQTPPITQRHNPTNNYIIRATEE